MHTFITATISDYIGKEPHLGYEESVLSTTIKVHNNKKLKK